MDSSLGKSWLSLFFCVAIIGWAGCVAPDQATLFSFGRDRTDKVPGITPPGERIALLRKLRDKAAWAKPDEQEKISRDLAAAYREEVDSATRAEIVRAIGGYPTAAAASVLQTALNESDPDVRVAACEAWGKRADAAAVDRLATALSSDVNGDVRLAAARALGKTGDPAAVPALGVALEDRDPAMQYRAMRSLRSCSGEDFGNDANRWRQYVKGEPVGSPKPVSFAERIRSLF